MRRDHDLLKYANTRGKGIEIAPYSNPMVPKRAGYDVLILDVFDTDTLRQKARQDPMIPNERIAKIEPVDIVGDASQLINIVKQKGLEAQIDYIVSAHNFEHLPNPIKFLQGVEHALKPGGFVSMIVPDYRACFDHFRMPTRLSDWLAAYHENRTQPNAETLFDGNAFSAVYMSAYGPKTGRRLGWDSPEHFQPNKNVRQLYDAYTKNKGELAGYTDAHCSVFFPESLALLLLDLQHIGLIKLEIKEISATCRRDFYVHLTKPLTPSMTGDDEYYEQRDRLLRAISKNLGAAPFEKTNPALRRLENTFRAISHKIRDAGRRLRGK